MSDETRDEELARLRAERDAYKMLADGRNSLLVAYRVGSGRAPEKAFRMIERAERLLAALAAQEETP